MKSNDHPAFRMDLSRPQARLQLITVSLGDVLDPGERDLLLTEGVVDLVSHLVEASADPADAVVVEVRLQGAATPAVEAFVDATRGLVQSYVLECKKSIGPVNVVVTSRESKEADRLATWEYLAAPTGTFSRGATYDLREASA